MERPSSERVVCRLFSFFSQLIGFGGINKGARTRAPFCFVIGDF
jgi:hypothetical protein